MLNQFSAYQAMFVPGHQEFARLSGGLLRSCVGETRATCYKIYEWKKIINLLFGDEIDFLNQIAFAFLLPRLNQTLQLMPAHAKGSLHASARFNCFSWNCCMNFRSLRNGKLFRCYNQVYL